MFRVYICYLRENGGCKRIHVPLAILQIMPPTVLKIESCFEQINCTCITDVYIILIFK